MTRNASACLTRPRDCRPSLPLAAILDGQSHVSVGSCAGAQRHRTGVLRLRGDGADGQD